MNKVENNVIFFPYFMFLKFDIKKRNENNISNVI